ncbi:MAG: hypothetical protein HFK08_04840 [Clostridia bacterium]|jgi:hypothetical protein|nr:hypothetical protein [Clostridia bacterium]
MKKKKDNREDWDDGRVVAPMNGDELPFYRRIFASKRTEKKVKVEVTKEERRALRKAMFSVMLPRLLLIIAGFGIAALVIFLWLH